MIRIRTLGGLSASRDREAPFGAATQPRRLAVLALVARAGDRAITREQLLALLWPDADDTGGRRALSQALHTLRADLHDDLFLGVQELRLNDVVTSCDVSEFQAAVAAHDWERAAETYGGPFLQGFRLTGAPEFNRWVEEERSSLAHTQAEVLERLARTAAERGDTAGAVGWWRRRAAMDALNARVTLELMRALASLGERHAALQQARIYEALLQQELALAPDADVVRYAEELRRTLPAVSGAPTTVPVPNEPAPTVPASVELPTQSVATDKSLADPTEYVARPARHVDRRFVFGALAITAAVISLVALRSKKTPSAVPLLAVGAIADYRGAAGTAPLTDMLASNLARIPGLQVTSTARLLELIDRAGKSPDAASFAAAARRAGASDLLEGGLHPAPEGLILELRRVDLATGRVLAAWRLDGKDFFTLVDRATTEFAASLGRGTTPLGPGEPNTRSLVAWRFYEEGLRRSARGDYREAQRLFESALHEDSVFAMAAYHSLRARSSLDVQPDSTQLAWLTRLARRTNDRDRLQILGWVAFAGQSSVLDAVADTLITRYPADIESQYLAGFARMARADFLVALPYLNRVLAADSASIGKTSARCLACDAMQLLVYAYVALDSIPRAHEIALGWTRSDPQSNKAWASLGSTLDLLGQPDEAVGARRRANPYDAYDNVFPAAVKLRSGDFATADQIANGLMAAGSDEESSWQGFWLLEISLRYQARWRELEEIARRRLATAAEADRLGVRGRRIKTTAALALIEAGRPLTAIRILDSLIRSIDHRLPLGGKSQVLTVQYTLLAEAALATGNVALVSRAADSATAWARRDGKIRELGIALHARALRELAAHDTLAAMRTFEQAIFSPTLGFTRSNYELARLLLLRREPAKAVTLLRAALQGSLESSNYYVTHTELHELLAEGYAQLGKADSARVHWSWVSAALARADASARPRYVAALTHLGAR